MSNEKTYFAMVTEELCAQFVPNTSNLSFGGKEGVCRYNKAVNCEDGYCAKCGWNPSEHRRRVRKVREQIRLHEELKRY